MASNLEEIVSLINFTYESLKTAKEGLDTYDEDNEADHEDGQYCGRVTAYENVLQELGARLQKI